MRRAHRQGIAAIILAGTVFSPADLPPAVAAEPAVMTVAAGLRFPEGTIFVGDDLYFVDYERSDVLRLAGTQTQIIWHQDGCGANGLVAVPGGLLVACFDGATVEKISLRGDTLATISGDSAGQSLTAPNDLTADRRGGVYLSDSGGPARPGRVLYIGADSSVREVASGIRFANGIGISPNGATLYVADSPTGTILAFPIKPDGSLASGHDLIRLHEVLPAERAQDATPDSLRVDAQGNVFVALYKGGGIAIVSPGGRLLRLLDVPGQHHTNLAISPDGKSLFVTAVDDDTRTTYRGQIVRVANPLAP